MNYSITLLRKALQEQRTMEELRSIVETLLNKGYEEDTLLTELEAFREQSEDDPYEDVVLEVMDFLTGWCSPHMRIQKPDQSPLEIAI